MNAGNLMRVAQKRQGGGEREAHQLREESQLLQLQERYSNDVW